MNLRWASFDVETSGTLHEYALQPWRVKAHKAWITTFAMTKRNSSGFLRTQGMITQVGEPGDFANLHAKTKASLSAALDVFIEMKAIVVGWNVPFDISWLLAYGLEDKVRKLVWIDAMMLWKHLDIVSHKGGHRYSLDAANKAFEPRYVDYKHDVDYHDWTPAGRAKLLAYNKSDTEATLLHGERFWSQLTERQRTAAKIEAAALVDVAKANLIGMTINIHAAETLDVTLTKVAHACAEKLAPFNVKEAQVRSAPQLTKLLYTKWGLPVVKHNKVTPAAKAKAEITGVEAKLTPSTDKDALHELVLMDDRIEHIGMWREALNLRSKFSASLLTSVDYNEEQCISHSMATMFGTYTGRMTYSGNQGRGKALRHIGFALHQMKNDKAFRGQVVAPEGYTIVEFDAAGQEFRWMAIQSGDPTMLTLCELGGDAHSFMGAQISGLTYADLKAWHKADDPRAKRPRKAGKVANLSLQYRTYPKRLRIAARVQHGLKMDEDEAKSIWLTYQRTYPGVPIFWKAQAQLGREKGYAETLAGRRVQLEGDWDGEHQWAMESTMVNYPIQGTGGDQKYLAMACMQPMMLRYNAYFGWDLHDGMYYIVPTDRAMQFAIEGRKLLAGLPYNKAWGLKSPIPLPWDAKIGQSWGGLSVVED